jgi:cytochrome b561
MAQEPSSKSTRYTLTAMALHWLLAVVLFGLFGMGVYMSDLPFSLERLKLYNWHKWAGVTVLILSVVRIGWRLKNPPRYPPRTVRPVFCCSTAGLGLQLGGGVSGGVVRCFAVA